MDVQTSGSIRLRPLTPKEIMEVGSIAAPRNGHPLIGVGSAADDWPHPFLGAFVLVDGEGALVYLGGSPIDPERWVYERHSSYEEALEVAGRIQAPVRLAHLVELGFYRIESGQQVKRQQGLWGWLKVKLVQMIQRRLVRVANQKHRSNS